MNKLQKDLIINNHIKTDLLLLLYFFFDSGHKILSIYLLININGFHEKINCYKKVKSLGERKKIEVIDLVLIFNIDTGMTKKNVFISLFF